MIVLVSQCSAGYYTSSCGAVGSIAGYTWITAINSSTNTATFSKSGDTTDKFFTSPTFSTQAVNVFTWKGSGSITYSIDGSYFNTNCGSAVTQSGNTFTFTGQGSCYGKSLQNTPSSYEVSLTSVSGGWVCIGINDGETMSINGDPYSNGMMVYCTDATYYNVTLTCPNGCLPCNAACSTCTGSANTQCSACKTNYFLQPSSMTCLNSCPSTGYYPNTTSQVCSPCDSSCTQCTGPANTQCSVCMTNYFLQPSSTTCLDSCPSTGYYPNSSSQVCSPCDASCSTCTGSGNTQCSACKADYFLQPSSATCLNSCPSAGYYPNSSSQVCSPCDASCSTCTGSGNSQCSACKTNYFLQPSSTTCLNSCPSTGYYPNTISQICSPCDASCAQCTGSANTQCSACKTNYFLQPSSTTCLNSCPSTGYYPNSSSQVCSPCDASCSICTGPANTQCSACKANYFLQPSSTTCLNSCPSTGYYPNSSSQVCSPCDASCSICTGPVNTPCSACKTNYFLQPSSTTCLGSCPSTGYYPNTASQVCSPCDASCSTCAGSANTQCSACKTNYFLQPNSTTCLGSCPSTGYYPNTTSQICIPCNVSCAQCTGPANTQCSACNSSYFLQPNSTTCLGSCPTNYWEDVSINICQLCYNSSVSPFYSCKTCDGGTKNNCTSCNAGTFLHPNSSGTCLNLCPMGFWGNNFTNTCETCFTNTTGPYFSCATCTTIGSSNCTSCNSGYFLFPNIGGSCLSSCPSGYWPDNTTNNCQSCSYSSASISSCSKTIAALQTSLTSTSTSLMTSVSALQSSNSASGIFAINLFLYLAATESMANMQYLNINHSQLALNAYLGLSSSLIPNWISNYNTIEQDQLVFDYGVFAKNKISPLYLDNYGDTLTQTLIYAGLWLLLLPIILTKERKKLLSSRLGKAYAIALGLFLSTVFGQTQTQILYSILQILNFGLLIDTYSRMSYAMACLTMYAVMWMQLICFCKLRAIFSFHQRQMKKRIIRSPNDTRNQKEIATNINLRWTQKSYKMMFESFKSGKKNQFFFTYWSILFNIIYILLIICLQAVPILQCLSIVVLMTSFIIFTAILKPIKKKPAAAVFFFNSATVLLMALLNLSQAIRDYLSAQPRNNDDIGWAIFMTTTVNSGINLLCALCGLLHVIYSFFCNKWKKRKQSAKTVEAHQESGIENTRIIRDTSLSTGLNQTALNLIENNGRNRRVVKTTKKRERTLRETTPSDTTDKSAENAIMHKREKAIKRSKRSQYESDRRQIAPEKRKEINLGPRLKTTRRSYSSRAQARNQKYKKDAETAGY